MIRRTQIIGSKPEVLMHVCVEVFPLHDGRHHQGGNCKGKENNAPLRSMLQMGLYKGLLEQLTKR